MNASVAEAQRFLDDNDYIFDRHHNIRLMRRSKGSPDAALKIVLALIRTGQLASVKGVDFNCALFPLIMLHPNRLRPYWKQFFPQEIAVQNIHRFSHIELAMYVKLGAPNWTDLSSVYFRYLPRDLSALSSLSRLVISTADRSHLDVVNTISKLTELVVCSNQSNEKLDTTEFVSRYEHLMCIRGCIEIGHFSQGRLSLLFCDLSACTIQSESLEYLDLTGSAITTEGLRAIILSCPNLKHLSLGWTVELKALPIEINERNIEVMAFGSGCWIDQTGHQQKIMDLLFAPDIASVEQTEALLLSLEAASMALQLEHGEQYEGASVYKSYWAMLEMIKSAMDCFERLNHSPQHMIGNHVLSAMGCRNKPNAARRLQELCSRKKG